jgi:uncharacterized protein YjdB
MDKTNKHFGFLALVIFTGLIASGCFSFFSSLWNTVSIRVEGNLSSVRAGGTLRFSAAGQEITWMVSSTSDGNGPVASGTAISSNGVLSVSPYETSSYLYVIATSAKNNESANKQIRVVTVTGVTVSAQSTSVTRGRTLQFHASVTGNNNPDNTVTWRVSSDASGAGYVTSGTSISANGLLTVSVNEPAQYLFVFAASVVDPSKSGSTAVSVLIPTVTAVTVSPQNQSVIRGRTLQFYASVMGINDPITTVTWRVSSDASGAGYVTSGTSISANGLLTVSASESLTSLYVIATSVADPSKSGIVPVFVLIPTVTAVTVSPSNQSVSSGGTLQFFAAVTGTNDPNTAVTWGVSSNAAGNGAVSSGTNINANGLLTVAVNEAAGILYIFAISVEDQSKFSSVTATVVVPTVTGVTINPINQSITRGRTLQFHASVTGNNNPANTVTWRVSSNIAGTGAVASGTSINNNGLLTVSANENSATLYVIAASTIDPSKSSSTAVTIIHPTVTGVTISPSSLSVQRGGTFQFHASVTGSNNPDNSVTWRVSSNANGRGNVTPGTNINNNGLLTVSPNETVTTLYVTAASTVDRSKTGSAVVNVIIPVPPPTVPVIPTPENPPVTVIPPTPPVIPVTPTVTSVTVSPSNLSVNRGGTVQFSASVTGNNNPANTVTWKVSSNAAGTGAVTSGTNINANGLLAVSANETITALYVIAVSTADPSKSGSASVTVIIPAPPVISVTVSPSGQTVQRGSPLQLSASVSGTSNQSVTWRVSTTPDGSGGVANGTTINPNGRLSVSANETAPVLYVIATSVADTSKSGSTMVTVIQGNSGNQGNQGNQEVTRATAEIRAIRVIRATRVIKETKISNRIIRELQFLKQQVPGQIQQNDHGPSSFNILLTAMTLRLVPEIFTATVSPMPILSVITIFDNS